MKRLKMVFSAFILLLTVISQAAFPKAAYTAATLQAADLLFDDFLGTSLSSSWFVPFGGTPVIAGGIATFNGGNTIQSNSSFGNLNVFEVNAQYSLASYTGLCWTNAGVTNYVCWVPLSSNTSRFAWFTSNGGETDTGISVPSGYHRYAILRNGTSFTVYIDGVAVYSASNSSVSVDRAYLSGYSGYAVDWACVYASGTSCQGATPTVTINQAAGQVDPTRTSPINFTAVFSEAVTGFVTGDVSLSGTAGATLAVVTEIAPNNGTTYNVAVSGMTGDGTVVVTVPAGVATNSGGAGNSASSSTDNSVTYDTTPPIVTINQAVGQVDPTNTLPINFTVVFSEPINATTFTTADITQGGTATGIAWSLTNSGDNRSFTLSATAVTGAGFLVPSIAAGSVQDPAGNNNTASSSTDNSVRYDAINPTVTINQAAGQTDPTNASPINFTVVFSEAVSGFATGDVAPTGTAGATTATITETAPNNGTTYNVAVSGMTGDGTIVVTVPARVATDAANNSNNASTSTDNTVTYDTTGPTVTINQAAGQADPTGSSPIIFDVVFSEDVTGFDESDVTLGGTAGATTAVVTGSGSTFSIAVSGMTGNGTVTASIPAGAAVDNVGNGNSPSTSTDNTVSYNTSGPAVTINQAAGQADPASASPIIFTVVFAEPVTGFITGDVSLSGTARATTATVTEIAPNDGTTFNVAVSGMTVGGTVIASIPAAVAQDSLGNSNLPSSSTDNTVTFDLGYPTVTGSTPANSATVSPGPTQLIVRFNEDVKNDSSAGAANNVANYLLIEDGADGNFDTLSCAGGLVADDARITINSASYTNNGGRGPFVATLSINSGVALPVGRYRLFVCGTTSIEDLVNNELNNGQSDSTVTFTVVMQVTAGLPKTGFAVNEVTLLPAQPADKVYSSTDLWLEIPKLGVEMDIVGVPFKDGGWEVTWLNKSAGWLHGSAFPTWSGNSVLTGHVWDALNQPGPFAKLKDLKYGDRVKIHAFGQVYTYEIRESALISPTNKAAMLKHEEISWLTLITCENYDELTKEYSYRRMVRAVLVNVALEK